MKLFHFPVTENTRFVWQENAEKDPVLQATEALKQQTRDMLDDLKKLILEGDHKALNELGWKQKTGRDRKQKWENKSSGETVLLMDKDKDGELEIVKYKDRDDKEKVKTFARDKKAINPQNIKKLINNETGLKVKSEDDKDNSLKKVVTNAPEEGRIVAKYEDDKLVKTKGDFDAEKMVDIVQEQTNAFEEDEDRFEDQKIELDLKINKLLENYTIQAGDTISDIVSFCKNENGESPSWETVYEANKNNLRSGDPNLIFPGEKLKLPDGYKLDASALSAKQMVNLNDWYEEKKALEVRAHQLKVNEETAVITPAANISQRKVFSVQPGHPEYVAPENNESSNTVTEQNVQPGENYPLANKPEEQAAYKGAQETTENTLAEYADFDLPKIHEDYTERDRAEIKKFHKAHTDRVRHNQKHFISITKELSDAKPAYDIAKAKYDAIDPADTDARRLASPISAKIRYNSAQTIQEGMQHDLELSIESLENFNRAATEGTMERITQITVDNIVNLLKEGNQEDASEETIEKIANLALYHISFASWTREQWIEFAEKTGVNIDGIPFDIMKPLEGEETLPELQTKKENIEKFSNEIQKMRTRYQNLFDKSDRLQKEYLKVINKHQNLIQEIDEAIGKIEKENPHASVYDYSVEEMDGKKAKVFRFKKASKWTYVTRKGPSVTSTISGDNINADGIKSSDWEKNEDAILQLVPTFAYKHYEYGRLSIQSGVDYTQRPGDESVNPDKEADASVVESNSTEINDKDKVDRWKELATENELFDWTRGTGLVHIDKNGKMTLDRVNTAQSQENLYKTATHLKGNNESFGDFLTRVKNEKENLFQAPVALWDGEVTEWREGDGIKAQFIVEFENGKNGFITFDDDINYSDAVTRLKQRGDIDKAIYVDTAGGSEYIRYWNKDTKNIQEQGQKNPQHGGGMLMLTD